MLRWTVRAIGGPDANSRLFRLLPQTSRVSKFRACPLATVAGEPGPLVVASPSARNHLIEECGAPCSWNAPSAIHTLKQFLSPENIRSDRPCTYSLATIRSLYYRAESRNQLGMLDSAMLSLLMDLFGSLSIDPSVSIAYRSPLASRLLPATARRTHWAFVLKVGRCKLAKRLPLQDSDRFWLMRAELGVISPSQPLSSDAYNAILRARTHYRIMRRHSRCPEVHAHYLEALLAFRDPRILNLAARDLSFLLRTHRVFHPRLQRLLYRLAILHGEHLSTLSQEAILTAFWCRSHRKTSGNSDLVPVDVPSNALSDNCVSDATTIACSLSAALFGFVSHSPDEQSANLFRDLFSVFSPAYALPLRWSSLVLFSIFNSSELSHSTGTQYTSDHVIPQITSCWQVIFGLATVERIILQERPSASTTPTEGVLEMTRTLYQLWLPIRKSWPVSRDLPRAVVASFLRVACILADATLFRGCQDLYSAENSLDRPRTSAQKLLTARYIAAAARIQGSLPDVVPGILESFSSNPEYQRQVLTSAVTALAPVDALLAHTLYSFAQGRGVEPDLGALYTLAISFAQRGAFRKALLFAADGRFSPEYRGMLISTIARSLRETPRSRHPPDVFVAITDELAALYHLHDPPEHFRGHLEQLFITLAQHDRGTQLFPVIHSIFKRLPLYFQPQFLVRYCRVLIKHGQISTASKLPDVITTVHPKMARSLRFLTDRAVMQTRTFNRTTPDLRVLASLRSSSHAQRHPSSGPPLEIVLQELLKSGRVLAAKRIFACAAATISSRRCTALGNILLHGVSRQSTSHNGRRVRKVLALMESLAKHQGFRPDGVTTNILIKAMINWRSAFDSLRLRELFDQLVRGGYPGANYSSSHLPFGTQQTQISDSSRFSKLSPFVSFEKHTKPLFKMFIKAFYLCNDVEAARKVVGILKVEASQNVMAKEVRQAVRSRGRIKADQRNAIPLDATVSSVD